MQLSFRKKRWSKTKMILLVCAIVCLLLLPIAMDSRLLIRTYTLDAPEITAPVRIALVTDLHSCYYGDNQSQLIETVAEQSPDLLLLGGDIFDDEIPDANTETFLAGIAGKYPCYYVTGNHECWSGVDGFAAQMAILQKYGIPVLCGTYDTVTVNGQVIHICGVDDPEIRCIDSGSPSFDDQLTAANLAAQSGNFTILLSHRPERFAAYAAFDFDLVLCGHAHGGQWRIPYLLNGLIAPNQGLFPKYAGGLYEQNGTTMIVSRGLARESTWVPRIFNRPELVIVEIQ